MLESSHKDVFECSHPWLLDCGNPCRNDVVFLNLMAVNQLARQFNANQPNQAYVGDMTYIPTDEGSLSIHGKSWTGLWQNA
jgi:hypothetical protein